MLLPKGNPKGGHLKKLEPNRGRRMTLWKTLPGSCQMRKDATVVASVAVLTALKKCRTAWMALFNGVLRSRTCPLLLPKRSCFGFFEQLGRLPKHQLLWSVSFMTLMAQARCLARPLRPKHLDLNPRSLPEGAWSSLPLEQRHRIQSRILPQRIVCLLLLIRLEADWPRQLWSHRRNEFLD